MATHTALAALHGYSGVGKDYLAAKIIQQNPAAVHAKFALTLRALVYSLNGYDPELIGNKEYEHCEGVTKELIAFNRTYRSICPDLMISGLSWILSHWVPKGDPEALVVISDLRQPNEYHWVVENGGVSFLLVSPELSVSRPLDKQLWGFPFLPVYRGVEAVDRVVEQAHKGAGLDLRDLDANTFQKDLGKTLAALGARTKKQSVIELMLEQMDNLNPDTE